jgi:sugar transferase (PEP-CTERM/EpsH1 system associated)
LQILYLAHRIPYPPNKGEKTRCFHQLDFLSRRHSIDLFCFADSPEEAQGSRALRDICRSVYVETLLPKIGYLRAASRLLSTLPASVAYYDSPAMHRAVRKALSLTDYDLIFVYCSSVAQFVPVSVKTPTVIDFVDADSAKWTQYSESGSFGSSWLYAREGVSLARYEKRIAEQFNLSFVTTRQDAIDLGGGGCRSVEVVPNGVKTPPALDRASLPADIRGMQPYALFVGTMNYRPNADAVVFFAKEVLPLIHQTHPELRFLIVGRDPAAAVRKLAQLPGVVVTGAVPDVHLYLAGACVAVAPFRIAQGIQNKVLEALVSGVPVVLTSKPARAISGPAAQVLSVADTPKEFAASVRSVLENPELRQRSLAAAPNLQTLLAWEPSLTRMEAMLASLAGFSPERELRLPVMPSA